jgi:fructosamine-3-kinase
MIPEELKLSIGNWLVNERNDPGAITDVLPLGGGCINQTCRINSAAGTFFVKFNYSKRYPGMFEAEAKGLELLRNSGSITVPEVQTILETETYSCLILTFIAGDIPVSGYWERAGAELAMLHRTGSGLWGLDHDNYIGSLPQINHPKSNGIDFLTECRLFPLAKMAEKQNLLSGTDLKTLESLCGKLSEILPDEAPALLHGDLWNGNIMTGDTGKICYIDPAVYYGHRETDLAMSLLFGGFPEKFYHAYNETFPLQPDWKKRTSLFQLYPILVHLILFGKSYLSPVRSAMQEYL